MRPLLPVEFDLEEFDGPGAAEKKLMAAVLFDAIACLYGYSGTKQGRHALMVEAREWIESKDASYLHSFENVCDCLKINSDRLRSALLNKEGEWSEIALDRLARPRKLALAKSIEPEKVIALFDQGLRIPLISRKLLVNQKVVTKIVRAEVKRRRAVRNQEIRQAYKEEWPMHKIADRFRLSITQIHRIVS